MLTPSLTGSQTASRRPTAAPPTLQRSFSRELHDSGLFGLLLRPREQLYGTVERAQPRPAIGRRRLPQRPVTPDIYVECSAQDDFERSPTPSGYYTDHASEESDESHVLDYFGMAPLKAATKVSVISKGRGKPKGSVTKSQKKTEKGTPKKRMQPLRQCTRGYARKVQKTEGIDVKAALGSSGKTCHSQILKEEQDGPILIPTTSSDPIEISSDEDETLLSNQVRGQGRIANVQAEAPRTRDGFFLSLRRSTEHNAGDNKNREAATLPDAKPSAPTSDWSFAALDKNSSDTDVDNDLVPTGGDSLLSYALTSPKTVKTGSLETEARPQRCNTDLAAQMTRIKGLEEELARVKREHSEELQKLRQEHELQHNSLNDRLDNAQNTITRLRSEEQAKAVENTSAISKLKEELRVAEKTNKRLEAKASGLQKEVESHNGQHDELQRALAEQEDELDAKNEEYEQLEKDYDVMQNELVTLADNFDAKKNEVKELQDRTTALEQQISQLKAANAGLTKDLERKAKRATLSPAPIALPISPASIAFPSSPAPSLPNTPSDQQLKTDNVRKAYVKVKCRYDKLVSVALGLSISCRGMDLYSFGEFGSYLKQLRQAIEEGREIDGADSQRTGGRPSSQSGVSA